MKRIISLVLSALLILSAGTVFAARPDDLAVYDSTETGNKIEITPNTTVLDINADNTKVTYEGTRHPSFGGSDAALAGYSLIDGVGMLYGTTVTESQACIDSTPAANRWMAYDASVMPSFTFEFENDIIFNQFKFTEMRILITQYTVEWYNDGVLKGSVTAPVSDTPGDYNRAFLRTVGMGDFAVADKVVFKVDLRASTISKGISISEVQFLLDDVAATSSHSSSGLPSTMIDGIGMAAADGETPQQNAERWLSNTTTGTETILISLDEVADVNTIKFTEVRKEIGKYVITFYNNGTEVITVTDEFTDFDAGTFAYIRLIELGQTVETDMIKMELTHGNGKLISIQEIEFSDSIYAPKITDADGNAVPVFNNSYITGAFNGEYDSTPLDITSTYRYQFLAYDSANNNAVKVKTPITIQFDLGKEKTFNYAQLSEFRCIFGEIDVYYLGASGWTLAGTMPKMAVDGDVCTEYIHSVNFAPVTARYVKYIIKEIVDYSEFSQPERTANINEISLYNYATIEDGVTIQPIQIFGKEITSFQYTYVYPYDPFDEREGMYKSVNTDIVIKNTDNSTRNYTIVGVQYDNNGAMLSVSTKSINVAAGETTIQNLTLPLKGELEDINSGRVSFMVWDGKTITPYCGSVSFEK